MLSNDSKSPSPHTNDLFAAFLFFWQPEPKFLQSFDHGVTQVSDEFLLFSRSLFYIYINIISHTCTKIRSLEWNDFLGPAKNVQGHQEKINKIIKTFMHTMKREVFHLFHFKWEKSRFVWIDIICRWNIKRKYRYNHIVKYCIKYREKEREICTYWNALKCQR